jgi:glycosyltransferase involved in cell wall biosynthesis
MFSKLEINSLIRCSDVVVSLHRAEGFGLVLAEAMLNGVPCIATNWSANTEFMNLEAACMVDYELVELKEDIGPFKKGSRWAEPDVKQAAEYMRRLYYEPDYRGTIAENAKKHIQEFLSMDRAVSLVNDRVNAIYGG